MINIHTATIDHAEAIKIFLAELNPTFNVESFIPTFESIISDPHSVIFIAEADNICIGFVEAHLIKSLQSSLHVLIRSLFVAHKFRKKGVAGNLIRNVEAWGLNNGATSILVQSKIERDIADIFYIKNGYSKVKVQNVYKKVFTLSD